MDKLNIKNATKYCNYLSKTENWGLLYGLWEFTKTWYLDGPDSGKFCYLHFIIKDLLLQSGEALDLDEGIDELFDNNNRLPLGGIENE